MNIKKWWHRLFSPVEEPKMTTVMKKSLPYVQAPDDPPNSELIEEIENGNLPPCFAPDTFRINDKVVCIDDSLDYGPFGPFPVLKLKKNAIYNVYAVHEYNVRGEVLYVHSASGDNDGYEARHFNLVHRVHTGDDPTPRNW